MCIGTASICNIKSWMVFGGFVLFCISDIADKCKNIHLKFHGQDIDDYLDASIITITKEKEMKTKISINVKEFY